MTDEATTYDDDDIKLTLITEELLDVGFGWDASIVVARRIFYALRDEGHI